MSKRLYRCVQVSSKRNRSNSTSYIPSSKRMLGCASSFSNPQKQTRSNTVFKVNSPQRTASSLPSSPAKPIKHSHKTHTKSALPEKQSKGSPRHRKTAKVARNNTETSIPRVILDGTKEIIRDCSHSLTSSSPKYDVFPSFLASFTSVCTFGSSFSTLLTP